MKCMEMKDVLQEVFLLPRGMKTSLAFSGLGMDHFVISSSLEEGSKSAEYQKHYSAQLSYDIMNGEFDSANVLSNDHDMRKGSSRQTSHAQSFMWVWTFWNNVFALDLSLKSLLST